MLGSRRAGRAGSAGHTTPRPALSHYYCSPGLVSLIICHQTCMESPHHHGSGAEDEDDQTFKRFTVFVLTRPVPAGRWGAVFTFVLSSYQPLPYTSQRQHFFCLIILFSSQISQLLVSLSKYPTPPPPPGPEKKYFCCSS